MSACSHAKPLGIDGWSGDGTPEQAQRAAIKQRVKCQCGWRGSMTELLACDEGCTETMWCPQCETAAWVYI